MIKRAYHFLISLALLAMALLPILARAQDASGLDNDRFCRVEAFSQEMIDVPRLPFADVFDRYVNPVALALVFANLGFATRFANIARVIQQLFQEPALLFLRRKRRGYGTVFESLSKKPVDLALVRVIDTKTNKVVASRVTDRDGRFFAIVPEGTYRFAVVRRGYEFPSRYLAGDTQDATYGRINTGQPIETHEKGGIDVNLPVDGPEDTRSAADVLKAHTRNTVHVVLAYSGLILGAISTIFAWTVLSWVLLIGHVALFLLFTRLTYVPFGKPWGTVKDQQNDQPLGRAVVRIVDNKYNKVLEQRVTNRRGQYGFIVGKNTYRLFTDKPQYQSFRGEPFDVRQAAGVVYRNISLKRAT